MIGFLRDLVETLLRLFPIPVKPGLRKVGRPSKTSPVLVTANYDLTVRRVVKELRKSGIDCYLLVCNTKGINVWCSSEGGNFTATEVNSAIKASKVGELVDHRTLFLPQLCASGVDPKEIENKTGWKAIFGPVYIKSFHRFLEGGLKKTPDMNLTSFPIIQRLEMATMWAFTILMFLFPPLLIWWSNLLLRIVGLVWILAYFLHIFYFRLPGRIGIVRALSMGAAFVSILVLYSLLVGHWSTNELTNWTAIILGLTVILGFDFRGNSPIERNEIEFLLHKLGIWRSGDRPTISYEVAVNESKCDGCRICVWVCPKGVYEMDFEANKAIVSRPKECMNCNACYRRCPESAIYIS